MEISIINCPTTGLLRKTKVKSFNWDIKRLSIVIDAATFYTDSSGDKINAINDKNKRLVADNKDKIAFDGSFITAKDVDPNNPLHQNLTGQYDFLNNLKLSDVGIVSLDTKISDVLKNVIGHNVQQSAIRGVFDK